MKWLWVSVVVLILDQWSKWLADATLALHESVGLVPFLAIRKAYNSGAAFSFLSGASGWQRWFFVVLASIIITVLFIWLRRLSADEKLARLGLVMILGGAVGNLVDRLVYGYVIDFIDVYYGSWHFPTFNIADAAISVGACLLLLDAFTGNKPATSAD